MLNKVTTLRLSSPITDSNIQDHIDEQNADGWQLVFVMDMIGWYRFFWSKPS
jgi:hypothetical protein